MTDTILDLWHSHHTADQIAELTGLHRDTVFAHIRRARLAGDHRADRRQYQAPSAIRRHKVAMLAQLQFPKRKIAAIVGISVRTVERRIAALSIGEHHANR